MKRFKGIMIISLVTVILLEVTLQLFYFFQNGALLFDRVYTPIYIKDAAYNYKIKPYLKYRHKTNEFDAIYYTNGNGFRCSKKIEEHHDSHSNIFNIILNGPSFAFGWGVNYEQCFASVLENRLKESNTLGEKDIQIIDFGVPCRVLPDQIKFFENENQRYNPKILLQFVYASMIVGDSGPSEAYDVKNGFLINKSPNMYASTIAVLKQSGIIFYSWIAYNRVSSLLLIRNAEDKIIGAGRDLDNFAAFDVNNNKVITSLKYYQNLKIYCDSINVKLIIIFFPLSYVVHNEDITRWKHLGIEDIKSQLLFNRQFCEYLNNNGIVCLNLTDDLMNEAKNSPQRLYYWIDIHWTPYGNKTAAKLVSKYLLMNKENYFNN